MALKPFSNAELKAVAQWIATRTSAAAAAVSALGINASLYDESVRIDEDTGPRDATVSIGELLDEIRTRMPLTLADIPPSMHAAFCTWLSGHAYALNPEGWRWASDTLSNGACVINEKTTWLDAIAPDGRSLRLMREQLLLPFDEISPAVLNAARENEDLPAGWTVSAPTPWGEPPPTPRARLTAPDGRVFVIDNWHALIEPIPDIACAAARAEMLRQSPPPAWAPFFDKGWRAEYDPTKRHIRITTPSLYRHVFMDWDDRFCAKLLALGYVPTRVRPEILRAAYARVYDDEALVPPAGWTVDYDGERVALIAPDGATGRWPLAQIATAWHGSLALSDVPWPMRDSAVAMFTERDACPALGPRRDALAPGWRYQLCVFDGTVTFVAPDGREVSTRAAALVLGLSDVPDALLRGAAMDLGVLPIFTTVADAMAALEALEPLITAGWDGDQIGPDTWRLRAPDGRSRIVDAATLVRYLNVSPKKERVRMSSVLDTVKNDTAAAAWRVAGSQFVKLARDPLVGLLCRHLGPNDDAFRARVAAFLETEFGMSLLAALLAAGVGALPVDGAVATGMARELRVRALGGAGDALVDVLSEPLRQVMALYLKDVGEVGALTDGAARVASPLVAATAAAERR